MGVASPHAAGGGADCTESMVATKRRIYAHHLAELDAEGISYVPVVWCAHGLPHLEAVRILVALSRATARRRGTSDASCLARRSAARIAAALWRRAARMVLACWPASAVVAGADDGGPAPLPL